MTEVYRDRNVEGLFALWLELPEGSSLRDKTWDDIKELSRKQSNEKLDLLRDELNTLNERLHLNIRLQE